MPKTPPNSGSLPPALVRLKEPGIRKVKVAVTDVDGVLRGKYMSKEKFLAAAESGFGFCNVVFGWDSSDACYDGPGYTGWHTGYPDALARVDLDSYRTVPWDGQVPFFLADFEDGEGRPLAVDPRALLKSVLAQAAQEGFSVRAGMEFEWFNFRETPQTLAGKGYRDPEPLSPGMFGYSLLRSGQNQPYFAALMDELPAFGVPLEGLHTETGPGVFEAAIAHAPALESADRAVLFKAAVKEIAHRFGVMPSFMAKWSSQLPGCSGHCHQSLWDATGKANLFHDGDDPRRMSPLFKSYLAGQLLCLPEILPFFAPTVNSYKRLVDGYWAPTRPVWGLDNRTTAYRVIPAGPQSTRLEARVPGSDVNPYLSLAACVAAGLHGIRRKLSLDSPPVEGSAYLSDVPRLPRTLHAATEALDRSALARELFGAPFVEHFVRTRRWEWRQFEDSVTDWELKRYFEII